MKDIWDSAKVAAKETILVFRQLFGLLVFAIVFITVGSALVAGAYFTIHWLNPNMPVKNAETAAVIVMILPAAAFGWFAIIFSVTIEEKRRKQ